MKRISILLMMIAVAVINVSGQISKNLCDLGITFEISNNPSWGYGEPVVLSVQPFSPADKAGIKVDDVIMEINSEATYLRNYPTINSWLTDSSTPDVRLTIRNINVPFREYSIVRDCTTSNAISEFDLASAYSFYDLEDNNDRSFSVPLKVVPNNKVNYSDYATFSFVVDKNRGATALDLYITTQIQLALESRGLVRNDQDPDMLVQSYYTYQPNVKYSYTKADNISKTWRFDTETQKMVQLPILSAEDPNAELKGQYVLELGIRFFDKKFIDTENLTQIWDCSSREFLTDNFSLEEYARIHTPLMLMQYPYSNAKTIAKYLVSSKKFNYTGLHYDPTQTGLILSVDNDSPAAQLGFKAGDEILKINETKFNYTPQELENGYKRFIVETMSYRNPNTKFVNASGYPDCMYWDKSKYSLIRTAFSKSYMATSFSYLFAFEKYISNTNTLDVEYRSNNAKNKIRINPQVQSSVVLRAL